VGMAVTTGSHANAMRREDSSIRIIISVWAASYLLRRLARDHPEIILERYERLDAVADHERDTELLKAKVEPTGRPAGGKGTNLGNYPGRWVWITPPAGRRSGVLVLR
jgi:hypothetical protein